MLLMDEVPDLLSPLIRIFILKPIEVEFMVELLFCRRLFVNTPLCRSYDLPYIRLSELFKMVKIIKENAEILIYQIRCRRPSST